MTDPKRIIVAGDAAVDWFLFPVPAASEGENWRLHPSARPIALPGGSLLLGELVCAARDKSIEVATQTPPGDLCELAPSELIHSNAMVDWFIKDKRRYNDKKDKTKVLRISESMGFVGPDVGVPPSPRAEPKWDTADVVILDDAGNGFRSQQDRWPTAIGSDPPCLIVHKMRRDLMEGALWQQLTTHCKDRHLVVINADDLRAIPGVDLSKSLSWERTAKDFYYQIKMNDRLEPLQTCSQLIVLFDTDAAIVYRWGEVTQATLVFDPIRMEGQFAGGIDGAMYGLTAAFTAQLAVGLAERGLGQTEQIVKICLGVMRSMLQHGFAFENKRLRYATEEIFPADDGGQEFSTCRIPPPRKLNDADPCYWRILDQKTRNTRRLVAEALVRDGSAASLTGVPVGKFGALETIDRAEIESYSAIRELIVEFLKNPKPARPLCFAVFGPPGSGKSFGVKQVLKSIGSDDLEVLTFNVSQFLSYEDLIAALHRVRDVGLGGKIPFVFFDEFDAASADVPLGWLKYFLAPMQDGEFREAGEVHPVGKAIFAFAGGTCDSYKDFESQAEVGDPAKNPFRKAKGTDFISRLRGSINVMGPNRQGINDDAYIIRRAKVLRGMLKRNPKAGEMFAGKTLQIDDAVLRALLHITKYRHGIRSIEAIVDMSKLAGAARFELTSLPPKNQLDLHVDADEFLFLARRERFQTILAGLRRNSATEDVTPEPTKTLRQREQERVEKAARLIHDDYVRHRRLDGQTSDTMIAFDELRDEEKNSNRDAAADIPHKLFSIGYGIRPIEDGATARTPDLLDEEVERLATMEHERWCRERRLQGFSYGPKRITGSKVHPDLKPYRDLDPDTQRYDVQAVTAIPVILAELGYELFRMKEVDDLNDPALLESIARALHEDYCAKRKVEGDTPDTNPSLVLFDELSDDLKAANYDNAATIPRKLSEIGYGLRKVRPGEQPELLELTDQEVSEMGMMEHARWNWQKILQGWVYKEGDKDQDNKTTPYLVPWSELEPKIQEYDLETVRLIPELIKKAGYETFRLQTT